MSGGGGRDGCGGIISPASTPIATAAPSLRWARSGGSSMFGLDVDVQSALWTAYVLRGGIVWTPPPPVFHLCMRLRASCTSFKLAATVLRSLAVFPGIFYVRTGAETRLPRLRLHLNVTRHCLELEGVVKINNLQKWLANFLSRSSAITRRTYSSSISKKPGGPPHSPHPGNNILETIPPSSCRGAL